MEGMDEAMAEAAHSFEPPLPPQSSRVSLIAPDCATQVREKELAVIRRTRMVSSMMSSVMLIQPLAVTVATFMVYGATGNALTASIILPALSLLGMLRFPLAFFPMLLAQLANLMVRASGWPRLMASLDGLA